MFEASDVVRIGPLHVPPKALEGVCELVDRAAIEFARGNEFVAGSEQHLKDNHLRGVTGCGRERRGAALESGDTLFQHGLGWISDAGINVAEGLQSKQRRRMVGVVEYERGSLIDRCRSCAGRRIRLCAGMDGQSGETGRTIAHILSCSNVCSKANREHADVGCARRQAKVARCRLPQRLAGFYWIGGKWVSLEVS